MEGRRVNRSAPRRNPLYVMFLCLVAAVFILLIVVIVLGARLGAAQRELKSAQAQIEELQKTPQTPENPGGEEETPNLPEPDEKLDGEDTPAKEPEENPANAGQSQKTVIGWLDLTGHSEVSVLPEKVFDKYAVYYTTDGVNLRAGPGTNYTKIKLVDRGTKVQAAAKSGDWTFVLTGGKYGWIKSTYLATTPPAEATSGSLKRN